MAKKISWKVKSSKEKYRNKWMRITEDEVVTENNETLIYGIVHKEPSVLMSDDEKSTETAVFDR